MGKPILINGAGSPVDTHDIVSGGDSLIHEPGTVGYLSDGRVYHWCRSTTAATAAAGCRTSRARC